MTDHDLDGFLAATRRHLDAELAATSARPDLAAAVARAREIDPDAVSAAAVREAAELPAIAQLRPRTAAVRETLSDRTALAGFTSALRDQLDADLARQIHRAAITSAAATLPPPSTATTPASTTATASAIPASTTATAPAIPAASTAAPATPASTTAAAPATPTGSTTAAAPAPAALVPLAPPRRRPLVALTLALAAAVLLAVGLRSALQARLARPGAIPGAAALASLRAPTHQAELRDPPRAVHERPVPEDIKPVPEDIQPVPEDSSDPPDSKDSRPAEASPPEPRPRPRKPVPTPPSEPPPAELPAEDPLTALDREAQALWRSGDLRGAADKFAEIVQRAPASRAAETAYGDLFALEHQLGGEPVTLWRAYLRQFPRGRYADDARAGVCRREPADSRARCWTDYLVAHPDGAHRREAEQAAP